jgi:hypothetical protein
VFPIKILDGNGMGYDMALEKPEIFVCHVIPPRFRRLDCGQFLEIGTSIVAAFDCYFCQQRVCQQIARKAAVYELHTGDKGAADVLSAFFNNPLLTPSGYY